MLIASKSFEIAASCKYWIRISAKYVYLNLFYGIIFYIFRISRLNLPVS